MGANAAQVSNSHQGKSTAVDLLALILWPDGLFHAMVVTVMVVVVVFNVHLLLTCEAKDARKSVFYATGVLNIIEMNILCVHRNLLRPQSGTSAWAQPPLPYYVSVPFLCNSSRVVLRLSLKPM